jgi:nicotinamidase-related amidase
MSSILIAIDLQKEFLSDVGRFPIHPSSKTPMVANLRALVPEFRKQGHIFWIKSVYFNRSQLSHVQDDSNSSASDISSDPLTFLAGTHKGKTPCCEDGSVQAEFHPEIEELISPTDKILTKNWYSAFKFTKLIDDIRVVGADRLYVCGLLSNVCVSATVLDALKYREFKVHAVTDCLGWRNEESHRKALSLMESLGVVMTDSSAAVLSSSPVEITRSITSMPKLYYVNGSIPNWRVQLALHEKVRPEIPPS